MDYEWYSIANDKYKYQTAFFSENFFGKRFSRLYHQFMLVAVAGFGGPIAITSDKSQILAMREDDPTIENIVIFNNQGEITGRLKINKPFQNVVVCLDFLQDEHLLAVFRKGDIWIIDPHTITYRKLEISGLYQDEKIVQVKVIQNFFVALTSTKRFIYVTNVFKPVCSQFLSVQSQINESLPQNLFWTAFAPRSLLSQKIQLHLTHPSSGIIQVIQSEQKKYFFNNEKPNPNVNGPKLPNIKGIKYISSLSPNKKFICYFSAEPVYNKTAMDQIPQNLRKKKQNVPEQVKQPDYYIYYITITPSLSSDSIDPEKFRTIKLPFIKPDSHLNSDQRPWAIKWCGNKALILQFFNQQLYLCSVEGDFIKIQKQRSQQQKWSYLKEQVDGTRIITRKQNKILRQIPLAYSAVFESFSNEPGALLYSAYQAFQDEAPLQDDQIRKDKQKLKIAVDQCVRASRFQLNFQTVSKLMRAATYGKAFLPPNFLPNNIIYENTKLLRIVNHMRQKMMRYITLDQFVSLKDDHLLKILLRYRQHYFAFQIHNYLKKDQTFRVKIFTDWACCKVQNHEQSQEQICQQIRFKLQNEKGISFTQIAHKSIEIGRSQLAMRLLQFEPSLSKKVPLLLWIGNRQSPENCYKFYEKGVTDALKSRDLNLLFLAIRKIIQSQKVEENQMFQMFSRHPEGVFAIINYYRLFDGVGLMRYYGYLQDTQKIIMQYIRLGIVDKKYENSYKLLDTARSLLKDYKPKEEIWQRSAFQKTFSHFNQFLKHNQGIKFKNNKIKPVTLSTQFNYFIKKGEGDAVDDMKNEYEVSDKRAIMANIKILIEQSKYQQLLTFVQKHQKKFKIPVEMVADFLLQKKQVSWAMKIIARMPEKQKDQQYLLLQRIGKIKEAIDLAADRKDVQVLEDIQQTLLDANLMAYINQKLINLRRR